MSGEQERIDRCRYIGREIREFSGGLLWPIDILVEPDGKVLSVMLPNNWTLPKDEI